MDEMRKNAAEFICRNRLPHIAAASEARLRSDASADALRQIIKFLKYLFIRSYLFFNEKYTTFDSQANDYMKRRANNDNQRRIDIHTGFIIHIFAAAHAATAVVSRLLDYNDDIPLTILTVSMLLLIAVRRQMSLVFTAVTTLVVTLVGYLFGVWCGQQLDLLLGSPLTASAITTFLLTELFGWSTYLLTRFRTVHRPKHDNHTALTRQIVFAALIIMAVRIPYSIIFRSAYFVLHGGIYAQFAQLYSNTFATLTMLSFIAILISIPIRTQQHPKWRNRVAIMLLTAAIFIFPLLPAVIAYYDFPMLDHAGIRTPFDRYAFAGLYAVALLTAVIAVPAVILIRYAAMQQRTIKTERSKKLSEQYKYAKLKQQISPHFLFNSLNILDSLVQSGENERAGIYIRKLAALYRYILKNEEEQLVTLGEELDFTDMYIDLLKVRFADGLIIDNRIPAEARKRHIVPCGLQMLIENAIKHNIVGAESPLHVTVTVENEFIAVANNLQPRISTQPSTRLSLKNLSRQYDNIAGTGIEVLQSASQFIVRLPLL